MEKYNKNKNRDPLPSLPSVCYTTPMQREVDHIAASKPTIEGAGVHLHRAFGYHEVPKYDPFLLLDDFGSENPHDYIMGFPWHPHRGIETVTYVFQGAVEHEDSLGNKGTIRDGDVQWMNAGRGIIHQEMPQQFEGRMRGFQLWVNLPAAEKMSAPRYQDITADMIPEREVGNGILVKVICGTFKDAVGPAEDLMARPEYLDATIPAGESFTHGIPAGKNAFIYVTDGEALVGTERTRVPQEHVAHLSDGDEVTVSGGDSAARCLVISGQPLGEPVSWRGPIVMNTEEEIEQAFKEYHNGTFIT